MDKSKILERLKNASPEERAALREALAEVEPDTTPAIFSEEEVNILKSFIERSKKKKGKGFLETLDSLFE